jgi:nitric oxide reductase subunit B
MVVCNCWVNFISGVLGTGHHYYYIGVGKIWLIIGGIFSALEPLAFLGMAFLQLQCIEKEKKTS